jgi:NADPH-dependent F420 reductase
MKIGIIGGTGPAGQSVGLRLASSGHQVTVGSRDIERSTDLVEGLLTKWTALDLALRGGSNIDAASCDVVVLATPWEGSVAAALSLSDELEGKVLVSMVNALAKVGDEFQALVPSRGSIAASLQGVLPKTMVTTAFQHLPARELGDLDLPMLADVMVCSDTTKGAEIVSSVISAVPGLRPVFCGSLASANAIEALTAVLLNINIRYRSHVSLRLSGLKEIGGLTV